MPWSVETENDDHFQVKGDSGLFKVSKAALSPSALTRMRGMAKGGAVRPASSPAPPRAEPQVDVQVGTPTIESVEGPPGIKVAGPPVIRRAAAPVSNPGMAEQTVVTGAALGPKLMRVDKSPGGPAAGPPVATPTATVTLAGPPVVRPARHLVEARAEQNAAPGAPTERDLYPDEVAALQDPYEPVLYPLMSTTSEPMPPEEIERLRRKVEQDAARTAVVRYSKPEDMPNVTYRPLRPGEAADIDEQIARNAARQKRLEDPRITTVPTPPEEVARLRKKVADYVAAQNAFEAARQAFLAPQYPDDVQPTAPVPAQATPQPSVPTAAPPVSYASQPARTAARMAEGGPVANRGAGRGPAPVLATNIAVREPGVETLEALGVPVPASMVAEAQPQEPVAEVVAVPAPSAAGSAPPAPTAQPTSSDPDLATLQKVRPRGPSFLDSLKRTPDQATMAYRALLEKGHKHEAEMITRSLLKPSDAVALGLLTPEDIGAQPGGVHAPKTAAPAAAPGTSTTPSGDPSTTGQVVTTAAYAPGMHMPSLPGSGMYGPGTILRAAGETEKETRQLGAVQQKVAQTLAEKQEAHAQEMRQWADIQDRRQAEGRTALGRMLDDIRNSKVDPDHFFADKSGLDRVRMGVGMLLGGIGAAFTGQPNLAAQFVQKSIERDIDAQKANIAKKQGVYAYYLDQMKDERAATAMTRAVLTNAAAAELEAAASRGGGDVSAQQHRQMAAQWHQSAIEQANQAVGLQTHNELQRAQLQGILLQRELMLRYMNNPGGAQGGGSGYVPSVSVPMFTGDIGEHAKAMQERRIDWKDAQGARRFSFGKPGQAKEANEQLSELAQIRDDINDLERTAAQASVVGSTVPWSEVRSKWDVLQGHAAMLSPSALASVKRLNENELNIGKTEAGDSIWKTKLNDGAALKTTKELLQRRQDAILRSQGIDERFLAEGAGGFQGSIFTTPRR